MSIEIKEISLNRRDVEARLAKVGDYVKMDYLTACLKRNMDFDTKKFVLVKLAEIYESRKMFLEAGKMIKTAADINTTFDGKIKDFVKSAELFIKAGRYDEGDVSFAKALAIANEKQKQEIKASKKKFVMSQAKDYLTKDKRSHALIAYEKLVTLDLAPSEKAEAQKVLLNLYQKLGKVREFGILRDAVKMGGAQPFQPPAKAVSQTGQTGQKSFLMIQQERRDRNAAMESKQIIRQSDRIPSRVPQRAQAPQAPARMRSFAEIQAERKQRNASIESKNTGSPARKSDRLFSDNELKDLS